MESNLVAEFVSETGASCMEAYHYLQVKGWDLKLAIHDYIVSKDERVLEISRPELVRSDSVDVIDSSCKKLTRGISRATDNINLINRARSELGLEFQENGVCNVNQYFIETPVFTFTLPDLSIFPDDFREFLEKDLIETSSLLSLEQAGRLNWWAENGVCQRLWPLATTGDGNCLLHAASLGMWGFHDRLLTLRRTLHDFLSSSTYKDALWRRWRWQLTQLNAEAGLVYTEEEWRKEWDSIVNMASSTPRNCNRRRSAVADKSMRKEVSENATYESLEEIHVLALSHVLKRPIVVIADTVLKDVHGEALAPILFGGIYLPLEIPPSKCHKSPLVLTFDAAHFSALVVMEKETFADKSPHPPAVIPLTDSHHKLLPIQFGVDPGENFVWGRGLPSNEKLSLGTKEQHCLLKEYLEIVCIPLSLSPLSDEVEFELESDTPCDEEDIEKRFIEANEYDFDDNVPEVSESSLFGTNRSRAAKQMKSVAKQFGSIGKSMSKKLKKNLGTITKMTRSNSQKKDAASQSRLANEDLTKTQDCILSARLHTEARHEYQEEMIKNYLTNARDRFEREKRSKQKFADDDSNLDDEKLREQAKLEGPKNCITQGCNMYGTVLTSYLCTNCYNKQRQEELSTNINSPTLPRAIIIPKKSGHSNQTSSKCEGPGYGMGRSTFYLEASPKSYESAKTLSMASGKTLKPVDETIRLSNSTFYNDRPQGRYYPKDWKSSCAGSGRSTLPYASNECQERPKTWQAEITNQIDDLGSLTLLAGCRPSEGKASISNADSARGGRDKTSRLVGEPAKHGTRTETYLHAKHPDGIEDLKWSEARAVAASCELHPQEQRKCCHLSSLEDCSRPNAKPNQESPTRGKSANDNFSNTARQSSQNSLDELIKETTEYYNENNDGRRELTGRLPDIPVELFKLGNVKNGKLPRVDGAAKKKSSEQYVDRKLCLNVTCKFFGSPELDNYCSMCYKGRCENLKFKSVSDK